MRLLFEINTNDYDINKKAFIRPSVRAIIIKNGKIGMVHSLKYDYYKFPGGGIETGETKVEALIREVKEEAGLMVIYPSIKPFGMVHRIQKGKKEDVFIQDNFYYICEVSDKIGLQQLDDYELDEHFTLEWIDAMQGITTNREQNHGPKDQIMIEREAKVLEILISEKLLK